MYYLISSRAFPDLNAILSDPNLGISGLESDLSGLKSVTSSMRNAAFYRNFLGLSDQTCHSMLNAQCFFQADTGLYIVPHYSKFRINQGLGERGNMWSAIPIVLLCIILN